MAEPLAKLAQQLEDKLKEVSPTLPNDVEIGQGLLGLYELRSLVSDCIAAIELKAVKQ